MVDSFYLDIGQSIISVSETWYKNLQVLGTGGNAVTFLVVATSGIHRGVLFAMKVFRKLSKPERLDSFLEEFRFLQDCNHPSIMQVFDTGTYKEQHPFFIAEYLPDTLDKVIRAENISVVEKISYALQLLSALVYLKQFETAVIHRDIKPQNIFVKGRSCVLGDFGLIKHANAKASDDREAFKESVGAGMPFSYRTPDQVSYLKGEADLTPKSDVFQLGLVLAELFTGRNPEKASRDYDSPVVLDSIGDIPGALSGSIANVIARMLEMDPKSRDDASQFLDPWSGIFETAVKRAHAIEGRAMW